VLLLAGRLHEKTCFFEIVLSVTFTVIACRKINKWYCYNFILP